MTHEEALKAACDAVVLGEDVNCFPVHLSMNETKLAIAAYLEARAAVLCDKEQAALIFGHPVYAALSDNPNGENNAL